MNTCAECPHRQHDGDSGPVSLRQAIADVCPDGTITFDNNYTITLTTSTLTIDKNMTIDGVAQTVTIDGGGGISVFLVNLGVTFDLRNLTVQNGYTSTGFGGGIYNSGTLNVTNDTFSSNVAHYGGGIYNNAGTVNVADSHFGDNIASSDGWGGGILNKVGSLTVTNSSFMGNEANIGGAIDTYGDAPSKANVTVANSTFYGNSVSASDGYSANGGAIENSDSSSLDVTNSTFIGNAAPDIGSNNGTLAASGIDNIGTVTLKNTILAYGDTGPNCNNNGGTFTDGGGNLSDDGTCGFNLPSSMNNTDPLVDLSGNYSGRTIFLALLPGSPAIDAGVDSTCAADPVNGKDQRGITRPQGPHCDIGAFESQGFTLTKTGGDNQSTVIDTAFADPLSVTLNETGGFVLPGATITFTAPSSGASISAPTTGTAPTNSSGIASLPVSANGMAGGPYTVVASVTGATDVDFSLTNTLSITPALTVTINQANWQADPTSGNLIFFTVVFSQPINTATFTKADVSLAGTAGATTVFILQKAPFDGTSFNIIVRGMSGNGTVIATIPAGVVQDLAGDPNAASTSTDNTVTYNHFYQVFLPLVIR